MPVKRCRSNNKPGWKWGNAGKCYTYTAGDKAGSKKAKKKAIAQGVAIGDITATEGDKFLNGSFDEIVEWGPLKNVMCQ